MKYSRGAVLWGTHRNRSDAPPNLSSAWFLPYHTIKMEKKIKDKTSPDAETGEFTKTLREKPFCPLLHLLRDVW